MVMKDTALQALIRKVVAEEIAGLTRRVEWLERQLGKPGARLPGRTLTLKEMAKTCPQCGNRFEVGERAALASSMFPAPYATDQKARAVDRHHPQGRSPSPRAACDKEACPAWANDISANYGTPPTSAITPHAR